MAVAVMVCPLCGERAAAAGCRVCLLPARDMVPAPNRSRLRKAGVFTRRLVVALLAYGAITAWAAWRLPDLLPFVVPAAVVAVVLHAFKRRPLVAALVFFLIVVVLPPLLLPSMATGWWTDLRA